MSPHSLLSIIKTSLVFVMKSLTSLISLSILLISAMSCESIALISISFLIDTLLIMLIERFLMLAKLFNNLITAALTCSSLSRLALLSKYFLIEASFKISDCFTATPLKFFNALIKVLASSILAYPNFFPSN
jgi:hypothetical protein